MPDEHDKPASTLLTAGNVAAAPQLIDNLPWFWRAAVKGYLLFQQDIRVAPSVADVRNIHASCYSMRSLSFLVLLPDVLRRVGGKDEDYTLANSF